MIKTTKKLICDICSIEVGEDIQDWKDGKIKGEAIKTGWLIDFPNGGSELLDICPECRTDIATRAAQLCVETESGGAQIDHQQEETSTDV